MLAKPRNGGDELVPFSCQNRIGHSKRQSVNKRLASFECLFGKGRRMERHSQTNESPFQGLGAFKAHLTFSRKTENLHDVDDDEDSHS